MARKSTPHPSVKRPFTKTGIGQAPEGPGVYEIFSKNAKSPGYIGSAKNIQERLAQHKNDRDVSGSQVRWRTTESTQRARDLEKGLIDHHQPKQNVQGKGKKK